MMYILFRSFIDPRLTSLLVTLSVFGEDEIKKEGYIMVVIVVVVGGLKVLKTRKM